jgi:hypothetical protein
MQGEKRAERTEHIFGSVGEALHFCFFMEVVPPSVRVGTELAIEAMRYRAGKDAERAESKINLRGLTQMEIRVQCQMVRNIVGTKLPLPERAVVWARHGYDRVQASGIKEVALFLKHRFPADREAVAVHLVAGLFSRRQRQGRTQEYLSHRHLSDITGLPRETIRDWQKPLWADVEALERQAEARLEPLFRAHGIVGDPDEEDELAA